MRRIENTSVYIPPPDYDTIRIAPPQRRSVLPHHYVPPNYQNPVASRRQAAADDDNKYQLSGEDDYRRRMKMIQNMGVPVLPSLMNRQPTFEPRFDGHSNKAFLHHVHNHRKYDTLHSLRTCHQCPLCDSIKHDALAQAVLENMDKELDDYMEEDVTNKYEITAEQIQQQHNSPIITGSVFRRPTMEELREEDEYTAQHSSHSGSLTRNSMGASTSEKKGDSLTSLESAFIARAKKDWLADRSTDLSVTIGELVTVIEMRSDWWLCVNEAGERGWLPEKVLYRMGSTRN